MSVNSYALALLALNDAKIEINVENISSILKKSKCEYNMSTIELFAEVSKHVNLDDLLGQFSQVGSGIQANSVSSVPDTTSTVAAPLKEIEKSESEESDADMGFGLFD